ncbi:DEAD/DEAH box helicase [Alkalicoccus luteus]|uniref:DEAD/DEAH box helicase n=1 Tax=Alkalicoccus luteus TaxID=1237094 RepID=UPI004034A618
MTEQLNELRPFLQENWEKAAYEKFTPVQEKMIPAALQQQNIICEAPTGSGKTLAYLLPALHHMDAQEKQPQTVIVVSSRELAMQVHEEAQAWTSGSSFTCAPLIGGANVKRQLEKLKKKPAVITGTPGRLLELIQQKKLKMHAVKTLVFDEADQLFSKEHKEAAGRIAGAVQRECRKYIVSATLPKRTVEQAKEWTGKADVIRINRSAKADGNVEHLVLKGALRDKMKHLQKLSSMNDVYAIVFCNDRYQLEQAAGKLEFKGRKPAVLHGETSKQEREKALKGFREGESRLLMTTDVASRGMDIEQVTHVIQLDLPNDVNQYVHRSGRTGRAGRSGTSVSLLTPSETDRMKEIAAVLKISLHEAEIEYGVLKKKRSV